MIRRATGADLPEAVRMARAFHEATTGLSGLGFCERRAGASFLACCQSPHAFPVALEIDGRCRGILIMQLAPYPMGTDYTAKELIFWIDPEHRGRWWRPMIAAAEDWSKSMGAAIVGMSCFADGRTENIFRRAGYAAGEVVLHKRL